MYARFHKHKIRKFGWLKKSKPVLNTGLYKTPIEVCQDNYKYISALVFRMMVYNNLRAVKLAKIKQQISKRKIERALKTYTEKCQLIKLEVDRLERIAAYERDEQKRNEAEAFESEERLRLLELEKQRELERLLEE